MATQKRAPCQLPLPSHPYPKTGKRIPTPKCTSVTGAIHAHIVLILSMPFSPSRISVTSALDIQRFPDACWRFPYFTRKACSKILIWAKDHSWGPRTFLVGNGPPKLCSDHLLISFSALSAHFVIFTHDIPRNSPDCLPHCSSSCMTCVPVLSPFRFWSGL